MNHLFQHIQGHLYGAFRPWLLPTGGASAWSPLSLFAASEQGAWYDPSDFSSMFQDSAGTTPVTAVEQPVGKINDKSGNGNHATQATAAARPVVSARVNLLLDSDGHAGATITPGTGLVVVATGLTDQRGGLTARQIRNTTTNEQHRLYTGVAASPAPYTVWVKNVDAGWVQLTFAGTVIAASGANFNLADGTVGTIVSSGAMPTASIVAEGGFYKCTITPHSSETGISNVQLYVIEEDIGLVNPHIAGTEKSVIIGGAQLGAGTYQRVTTATDYDTVGFPHYLVFDGVDDALLVGTVALPADADATVGAWRDTANNGMIFTRAALSSEFFGVYDPGSAASSTATAGAPTYAVNGTAVPGGAAVTRGQMHTAFTVASPCVVEALNLDLSAFTALNIGGYGASFSLVGRLYGVVICPAQQAATRTSLRQYLASKSGATL